MPKLPRTGTRPVIKFAKNDPQHHGFVEAHKLSATPPPPSGDQLALADKSFSFDCLTEL